MKWVKIYGGHRRKYNNFNDSKMIIPAKISSNPGAKKAAGKNDAETKRKEFEVDLAFAFTVWKVQGLTFDEIIL